jgi:Leishmanolysin
VSNANEHRSGRRSRASISTDSKPTTGTRYRHPTVPAGVDADVIVYVTSQPRDTCGTTLASAAACAFDPLNNRPVAGNIIFCTINPSEFEQDLATAVHELLHVLVRNLCAAPWFAESHDRLRQP